jgi:hypothetical protein
MLQRARHRATRALDGLQSRLQRRRAAACSGAQQIARNRTGVAPLPNRSNVEALVTFDSASALRARPARP